MIAEQILEIKLINQYSKLYDIFAQNNTLKLNLSNDNVINGIIQDVKAKNVNSTYKKEIITPYNTIKTGDYVTHTFNGKTINYLVESATDTEVGCDKAYLLECPYNVNIFDYDYNNILSFPISLKNNNAKLGVTESAISITANSSFDIILKYDIHTRSFVKSDNLINGIVHAKITRILLDGMAFRVIGVNHLISKGLLVISIENTNITPADNLELGVADYTTYYREPIDYNGLIDAEILKYEQNATITKDILANADVSNIVKNLKTTQTANTNITVSVSSVDADGLLTLTGEVVKLANQIPFEGIDNTTTATLTFSYGGVSKTLLIDVTIEKQDQIITDLDIVIAEMPKYETTALIGKQVVAETDITSSILRLKDAQTANPEVDTYISYVDTDGLLTLTNRVVTLTNVIPFSATDNETVANISFVKGEALRTISVFVTIEKQDDVAPPNLVITEDNGYEDLPISETNSYTINTTDYVTWSVTNVSGALTLNTTAGSNKCSVSCAYNTSYIGKQETLTAKVNVNGTEFEYTYIIYIVSMI
ncbi:hypothetical protein SDC9_69285 [bioreactor metagenome]|uniref:Uncharacterized protein n=1 Tax=bioreactor metagenome TaxID=1076179 RepID=A0A644Y2U5_9ZZZZ